MLSFAISVCSFVPTGPKNTCSTDEQDDAPSDPTESKEEAEEDLDLDLEIVEVSEVGVASGELAMEEKSSGWS